MTPDTNVQSAVDDVAGPAVSGRPYAKGSKKYVDPYEVEALQLEPMKPMLEAPGTSA